MGAGVVGDAYEDVGNQLLYLFLKLLPYFGKTAALTITDRLIQ